MRDAGVVTLATIEMDLPWVEETAIHCEAKKMRKCLLGV